MMKFYIYRTSAHVNGVAPTEGAIRGADDELGREHWTIEIPDLDALMEFAKREGEIILWADEPAIEIYDGYRE